jgi:hypothetical protein
MSSYFHRHCVGLVLKWCSGFMVVLAYLGAVASEFIWSLGEEGHPITGHQGPRGGVEV